MIIAILFAIKGTKSTQVLSNFLIDNVDALKHVINISINEFHQSDINRILKSHPEIKELPALSVNKKILQGSQEIIMFLKRLISGGNNTDQGNDELKSFYSRVLDDKDEDDKDVKNLMDKKLRNLNSKKSQNSEIVLPKRDELMYNCIMEANDSGQSDWNSYLENNSKYN